MCRNFRSTVSFLSNKLTITLSTVLCINMQTLVCVFSFCIHNKHVILVFQLMDRPKYVSNNVPICVPHTIKNTIVGVRNFVCNVIENLIDFNFIAIKILKSVTIQPLGVRCSEYIWLAGYIWRKFEFHNLLGYIYAEKIFLWVG